MDFRWCYVDDSGAPRTGWIVFGYLTIGAADWNAALKHWLDWRKRLFESTGISVEHEFHAVNFVNGRGNPSQDESWNRRKSLRRQVAREALEDTPVSSSNWQIWWLTPHIRCYAGIQPARLCTTGSSRTWRLAP